MKGPLPEHAAHWPAVLSSTFHWGQASSVGTLTMNQTVLRAIPPPGLPTATPTCTWASGLGSLDDRPLSQGCNPSSHTHSYIPSTVQLTCGGPLPEHAASPPGKAGNPLTGCPVSSPKMCSSGWFLCVDFSINTSVLHLWLGDCVCQGLIVWVALCCMSTHGVWYRQGSWNPCPSDAKGQLCFEGVTVTCRFLNACGVSAPTPTLVSW